MEACYSQISAYTLSHCQAEHKHFACSQSILAKNDCRRFFFINDDDKYCENGDIADKDKDDYDDDDEDKDKDDADEHKNAISDGGSTAL